MPLRAIINGEDIIASFLNENEWNDLKKRVKSENLDVRTPCCDNPAYLRTSKHGIHHFVHKTRGDCTRATETWQHLKAKQEIVRACRAAGYDASTEVEGDGWRADVLAVKGDVKIAFEVQWSPQTWEVTQERQKKYNKAGINRSCWFFKSPPEHYRARRKIPLFKLDVSDESCTVIFNPQSYPKRQEGEHWKIPLNDFIKSLMTGKIRFCTRVTAKSEQDVEIQFISHPCWNCGAVYSVYKVLTRFTTNCQTTLHYNLHFFNPDRDLNFAFHPEIQKAVHQYVLDKGVNSELANFTKYPRKPTNILLNAFQCPHCDALLGHKYLMDVYHSGAAKRAEPVTLKIQFEDPPMIFEEGDHQGAAHAHWCFPENQKFCCKKRSIAT